MLKIFWIVVICTLLITIGVLGYQVGSLGSRVANLEDSYRPYVYARDGTPPVFTEEKSGPLPPPPASASGHIGGGRCAGSGEGPKPTPIPDKEYVV